MSALQKTRPAAQPEHPASLYANRVRVYPKAVRGPVRRFKWAVLAFCLAVYYALPWLRWNRGPGVPDQAVLLSIWNERFYFFDLEFWPQDIWLLTGLMILGAVALFLVTSLFGRVWCGYSCPQTVWTDLYMWVERRIEGDRNERMKRDAAPLSLDKAWRKAAKHLVWLGIAFWTGGAWIMYYVDAPTVTREFWVGTASVEVYVFTFLFTATTYLLAGWAREQVCTYMCPWPRFQSAMLDDQSIIVTYQNWRGEPRTRGKQAGAADGPRGDCVDCAACVTACPTGIDIRDGLQLECINCGLCIDACNHVMEKQDKQPWLITWDTLSNQAAKAAGRHEKLRLLRPRTAIYVSALLIAAGAIVAGLATRPMISLSALHDRAPLFVRLANGGLRNAYTIKITNKTPVDTAFELSVRNLPGAVLSVAEEDWAPYERLALITARDAVGTFRVFLQGKPQALRDGRQDIDFVLRNPRTGEEHLFHSVFMGPGARQ